MNSGYALKIASMLTPAALLLRTDRNMKEIGRDVGWDDPNYFARCFRKYHGCSATEYRARAAARRR